MKFHQRNTRAAKLTPGVVAEIRRRYAAGDCTQGDLAREYGVTAVQIGRVVRGECWMGQAPLTAPQQEAGMLQRLLNVQKETEALRTQGLDGFGNPLPADPLSGGDGAVEDTGGVAERLASEAARKDPNALSRELGIRPEVAERAKEFIGKERK